MVAGTGEIMRSLRLPIAAEQHRLLGARVNIMAQDRDGAVFGFDFEVPMGWRQPSIDHVNQLDRSTVELGRRGVFSPSWPAWHSTWIFVWSIVLSTSGDPQDQVVGQADRLW